MQNPIARIQKRIMEVIQQELQRWVLHALKGQFSPEKMMQFMKSMGIDMSQLPGMMGQPGFDPYRVLGLDKSASDEEIKRRYNELLHKLHPDTAGVQGTEFLFQMVMAAYELIKRERGWA